MKRKIFLLGFIAICIIITYYITSKVEQGKKNQTLSYIQEIKSKSYKIERLIVVSSLFLVTTLTLQIAKSYASTYWLII